jgi:hypothetical protein
LIWLEGIRRNLRLLEGLELIFRGGGGGLVLTSIVEEGGYMAVFGWREKGRRDNLYRGVSI